MTNIMTNIIDNIFYINMDTELTRNYFCQQQLSSIRENIPIERVSAIKDNPGFQGCSRSHIKVLNKIYTSFLTSDKDRNTKKYFLILEDDFFFLEPFHQIMKIVESSKHLHWDVLCLDYCKTRTGIKDIPIEKDTRFSRIKKSCCTGGYIIKGSFVLTLFANFEEALLLKIPIDNNWWKLQKDPRFLFIRYTKKDLLTQFPFYSTIDNKFKMDLNEEKYFLMDTKGRLGNRFFQLVYLIYLSFKYNRIFCIYNEKYRHYWNSKAFYLVDSLPKNVQYLYEQQNNEYTIEPGKNYVVSGYFKKPIHFLNNISKKDLHVFFNLRSSSEPWFVSLQKKHDIMIGVHVRLGDDTSLTQYCQLLETRYYQKAFSFIKNNIENEKHSIQFFICSDSIDKVKSHFFFSNTDHYFYEGNEMDTLYYLTQCDYLILANSTFSFMASIFNIKKKAATFPNYFYTTPKYKFDVWYFEKEKNKMHEIQCSSFSIVTYLFYEKDKELFAVVSKIRTPMIIFTFPSFEIFIQKSRESNHCAYTHIIFIDPFVENNNISSTSSTTTRNMTRNLSFLYQASEKDPFNTAYHVFWDPYVHFHSRKHEEFISWPRETLSLLRLVNTNKLICSSSSQSSLQSYLILGSRKTISNKFIKNFNFDIFLKNPINRKQFFVVIQEDKNIKSSSQKEDPYFLFWKLADYKNQQLSFSFFS